jgi:hypothetical protein
MAALFHVPIFEGRLPGAYRLFRVIRFFCYIQLIFLVEPDGIEPTTSSMPFTDSPAAASVCSAERRAVMGAGPPRT